MTTNPPDVLQPWGSLRVLNRLPRAVVVFQGKKNAAVIEEGGGEVLDGSLDDDGVCRFVIAELAADGTLRRVLHKTICVKGRGQVLVLTPSAVQLANAMYKGAKLPELS